jgi:hypothetical protein
LPCIETLGIAAGRVEHQQRLASAESTALGGGEQRCTNTPPAYSSKHEHLREVPAMRLVLGLIQNDLNGADDRSRCVLSREHDSLATRYTRGHAVPVRLRFGAGHRKHEADGRATFHAVDQHLAQPLDHAIADGPKTSDLKGVRHFISSTHAKARWRRSRHIAQPCACGCDTRLAH